ncbi:MAG: transketolase [bacterium]|nr:transketolase [bacterium]
MTSSSVEMVMLDSKIKAELERIANTVRGLSIDAIEAAGCGHPGLPMGCAEIGAYLFRIGLRYNPAQPRWMNRDAFVLSAGHGSMLHYSLLHLSGYDVSLDDLKQFRKLHSPTAGHPEFGEVDGVETTTGPLGQGIAAGIGLALGQKIASARTGAQSILDSKVVILAGDGCMMEGVSQEASSFAGHLKLNNVILFYDSNDICLDGPLDECMSENTALRYEAYGWFVQVVDGHNVDEIHAAYQKASTATRPSLIVAKTVIGKGSPNMAGTSSVHGKALGAEEVTATKSVLGLPDTPFYVDEEVRMSFEHRQRELADMHALWEQDFEKWQSENEQGAALLAQLLAQSLPTDFDSKLKALSLKAGAATRQTSHQVLQYLHDAVPHLIGGSADLSCSDSTLMAASACVKPGEFNARNIKYGVREFAMAAVATGVCLQGMARPFCGTFLTFSDYMRNAIRLAALMQVPIIFQFTHDSILLGEDGPTHQPVEHLASLRAMPNLTVIRPADGTEVKGAWAHAMRSPVPVALILSRQGLPELDGTDFDGVAKGGYIVKGEPNSDVDVCILATGSELSLAVDVADELGKQGIGVRVVSMVSFELFNDQSPEYRASVLGAARVFVSIEAQSTFGWHQYIGVDGLAIGVDRFGLSAPISDLQTEFGFNKDAIVSQIRAKLG